MEIIVRSKLRSSHGGTMAKHVLLALIIALYSYNAHATIWVQDGGVLNIDTGETADIPSIAVNDNCIFVAWRERRTFPPSKQLFVRKWNGSSWASLGGSLNIDVNDIATSLNISVCNGTPYVAWWEGVGIYVKHWDGSSWVSCGGNISPNAGENPSLAVSNSVPYIAWGMDNNVYVHRWNGSNWSAVGGPLNVHGSFWPSLTICEETPYVAWTEWLNGYYQVYVKYWNGIDWLSIGGSLNNSVGQTTEQPDIVVTHGTPYVTWVETVDGIRRVYAKVWNSTVWQNLGGCLNKDPMKNADRPRICFSSGAPYVTWYEGEGASAQVVVKHWNGSAWVENGGGLNVNFGFYPDISAENGTPFVTWSENGKVIVKHFIADKIAHLIPNYSLNQGVVNIAVYGAGFYGTPVARLIRNSEQIPSTHVIQQSPGVFTFTFDLDTRTPQTYDLQTVGADGCQRILKQSFTMLSPLTAPFSWNMYDLGSANGLTMTSQDSGIVIGDADRDNSQELYAANSDQSLSRLKKYPYGWNTSSLPATMGANFSKLLLADGNNDQEWEIYTGGLNNRVYQYVGPAWIKSEVGQGPAGSMKITALAKADVDHDGISEIFAAGDNGTVCQFKYNGSSWIKTEIPGCPVSKANALKAGDGNNDHVIELYSANQDQKIYEYKYNGTSWQINVVGNGSGAMRDVVIGDGDNDGLNEVYGACDDGRLYEARWEATIWHSQAIGLPGGGTMNGLAVSDADCDGKNEVMAICEDGHVYMFVNNVVGWNTIALDSANTPLCSIVVGDADNDNHFGVYALGKNNHIYQFEPETLATPTPTASPTPVPPITIGDFGDEIINKKYFFVAPNPTKGVNVVFKFFLKRPAEVEIRIYTPQGSHVLTKPFKSYPQGWNTEIWNASGMANGVYFYIAEAKSNAETKKIKKTICLIK